MQEEEAQNPEENALARERSIPASGAKAPVRGSDSDHTAQPAAQGAGSPAPASATARNHILPVIFFLTPLVAVTFFVYYLYWASLFSSVRGIQILDASGSLPGESRTWFSLRTGLSSSFQGNSSGDADADASSPPQPSRTKRTGTRANTRTTSRNREKPHGKGTRPTESGQSNLTTDAQKLFDIWTLLYRVEAGSKRRLEMVAPDGTPTGRRRTEAEPLQNENATCSSPRAPHLQCCDDLAALREWADKRGPKGELPLWMAPQPGNNKSEKPYPRPPWVQGSPEDNLPLTHQAQADIWQHQHPADGCAGNGTRFLVSWWKDTHGHGIGSHLHLMTAMMGWAMASGRVFGLMNDSFERAQHDGCKGANYKSYACYFHVPLSAECDRRVHDMWHGHDQAWRSARYFTSRVTTDLVFQREPFLVISPRFASWTPGPNNFVPTSPGGEPRACATCFVGLRHTSATSSTLPGTRPMAWKAAESALAQLMPPESGAPTPTVSNSTESAEQFLAKAISPEGGAPPDVASCLAAKEGVCGLGASRRTDAYSAEDLFPEVWIPRPVVRVHVRGTDKYREMPLQSAQGYLRAAEEIAEALSPNSSTPAALWLSSEEQSALDVARNVTGLRLYTLHLERKYEAGKNMPTDQWQFATAFRLRDYVEASLANMMVSQHSDGFVLAMGSNWDRLANELRLTNGRLHAPIRGLNQGEM